MKDAAVFLDRDGTLIEDSGYIDHPEKVRLLPGAAEAIRRFHAAGFRVVVASNQSGVARGFFTEQTLLAVHERMEDLLRRAGAPLDAAYYCPYLPGPEATVDAYRKDSPMRKPKPGMLLQAAKDLNLDLGRSWMVGDAARDIEAGAGAGCRTALIERNGTLGAGDAHGSSAPLPVEPDLRVPDIFEAANQITTLAIECEPRSAGKTRSSANPDAGPVRETARPSAAATSTRTQLGSDAPSPSDDLAAISGVVRAASRPPEKIEVAGASRRMDLDPGHGADESNADPAVWLERIHDQLDRANRRQRQHDFSILRLIGALLQMMAIVSVAWGLAAVFNDQPAAATPRLLLACFFQFSALTAFAIDRFR